MTTATTTTGTITTIDHDHEHDEHCDHPHHHHHDDDVKSFVFRSDKPFAAAKLEDFLGSIVQVYGPKMLRYKGVLYMKGSERKVVFQGVHQLMGSDLGPKWSARRKEGQQDGFHRHRPAARNPRTGAECLLGVAAFARRATRLRRGNLPIWCGPAPAELDRISRPLEVATIRAPKSRRETSFRAAEAGITAPRQE